MKFLDAIVFSFTDPKIRNKAILYSVGLFLLFGIITVLIPNPIFIRMIPSNIFDYIFLITTVILSAIFLSLPETKVCSNVAAGGTVLGVLAFACPTCNAFLVYLLGANFLFSVFDPLRPIIGFLSIIFLLYAIDKKWEFIKFKK